MMVLEPEAAAERDYWLRADPVADVFGLPGMTGQEGVEGCLANLVPVLEPVLSGPSIVLDLGCGVGRLSHPVARRFPKAEVWGIDISEAMLRRARDIRADGEPYVLFDLCDGRTLPPLLPALDAAFSVLLFQHLEADAVRGYIRQVADRLRSGGVFRFQFCARVAAEHFLSHAHDPEEVSAWCREAGFALVIATEGAMSPEWCWVTAVKQ